MVVTTKKQDKNNNKKEPGKKDTVNTAKKDTVAKEAPKKDLVLSKNKKEPGKKELTIKKDRAQRAQQVKDYFRGVISELKKVHWPTRREVVIYTGVVVIAVIIVGILIWLFDAALSTVLGRFLQR